MNIEKTEKSNDQRLNLTQTQTQMFSPLIY